MTYRLGIDLGGTTAKCGVIDQKNRLIWVSQVSSSGDPSPRLLVSSISNALKPQLKKYQIRRIGAGVAGDIDFKRGMVRVSPNLGWKNVPLKKLLTTALGVEIVVDNDANVAAWGIYKSQVSSSVKNMMVLTLGTGVGGGLIMNGELYRGATGSAGEAGHMIMDPNGDLCNCGLRGCLETFAGGFHIARRVRLAIKNGQKTILRKMVADLDQLTPRDVATAAHQGDLYARGVWGKVGQILGRAVGDLIYVYNPDCIYFTGGVAQAGSLLLKPLNQELLKRPFQVPVRACRIKIAKHAPHIGVVGAALL